MAETDNFYRFGRRPEGKEAVGDASRCPWQRQVHLLRERHACIKSSLGSSMPGLLSRAQPLSLSFSRTHMSWLMNCYAGV